MASVKPGDRVAVEPILSCTVFGGTCPMCRIGKYQLCESGLTHVGMPITRMLPGGFGEYSIVHETRLFPIPDHISFEEAALLDILAVNVHAINIGRPTVGATTAVMGCGIIGLDMIQCLRVAGAGMIIAIAKYPFQAEIAARLGATATVVLYDGIDPVAEVLKLTDGRGVDQAYECVGGHTDAVSQCVSMCCSGGSVIMLGGASKPRPIDLQAMLLKEVNILSSNSYSTAGSRREFQIALDLLRDRRIDHTSLVTHRFSPENYRQAFDVSIAKTKHHTIKAVFVRD